MAIQRIESGPDLRSPAAPKAAPEYPVREYIGAMALELGQMARWSGDEALARMLDSAASMAAEPLEPVRVDAAPPEPRRPG